MAEYQLVEELRKKWAKLLLQQGLDIHTKLLISLFIEDISRLERE